MDPKGRKAMKSQISLLFAFFLVIAGCRLPHQTQTTPKNDGKKSYEEFVATVKTFPYEAPLSRKDRIVKKFSELEIGMSKDQVTALIGEPDFSRLDYGPKGPNERWQGSSWSYYLFMRENSANNNDSCLAIHFGVDDHAVLIIPENIDGLIEKASPSHRSH